MKTKEILTIIGLIFLGLCFLCGLAKMGMKDAKRKGNCDKACGAFVFLGVALIAVSSVLKSSGPSPSPSPSPVPLGGNCSAELGQNCAPGLQCVRFGAAGNAQGKCMLPLPGKNKY